MFHLFQRVYLHYLPNMVKYSAATGFVSGMTTHVYGIQTHNKVMYRHSKPAVFTNIIGYTTIGAFVGVFYPISYPALLGYVIYKNTIPRNW
jgi:hypothetical protein